MCWRLFFRLATTQSLSDISACSRRANEKMTNKHNDDDKEEKTMMSNRRKIRQVFRQVSISGEYIRWVYQAPPPLYLKDRCGDGAWWEVRGQGVIGGGSPTTGYFLSRVRRHDEYKQGEAGEKEAGYHQVKHVVEVSATDVNGEGHVNVFLGTAVVADHVTLGWGSCKNMQQVRPQTTTTSPCQHHHTMPSMKATQLC